jgi:hypothetical protein
MTVRGSVHVLITPVTCKANGDKDLERVQQCLAYLVRCPFPPCEKMADQDAVQPVSIWTSALPNSTRKTSWPSP